MIEAIDEPVVVGRDIVAELEAKAWQSTRRGKCHHDHVCWRAALEIKRLRKIQDASQAERGWRAFWQGIVEYLHLDSDQRTYEWHSLMDACRAGIATVKRDCG